MKKTSPYSQDIPDGEMKSGAEGDQYNKSVDSISETKPTQAQIKAENDARFREIRQVLARNKISRGISPEKLRIILEELGPTYIKLGQIMSLHSDMMS